MPATVVGPSFKVSGWTPPGWLTATPAQRLAFWEAVRPMVLKAKDAELKAGLDRYGKAMAPLAASTVKHRKSAMGPADPGAPPLQPAHGLSRTRSLLVAKATLSGVVCWWLVDKHTGASWGEILKHHRAGSAKLPVRDVIGLSTASKAKVKKLAWDWWEQYLLGGKRHDFGVGSATQAAEAKVGGHFSGWHTAEEAEANLKASGVKKVAVGKFDFSGVFNKPSGPPPVVAPTPPTQPTPTPKKPAKPKPSSSFGSFSFNPPVPPPTPKPKPKPKTAAKPKSKPARQPTVPPVATPPASPASSVPWPKDLSGLVEVKVLGGSTGAKLVEDPATGRRYVLKRGGNPGHLKSEAQADALYRAAGVDVPRSRIYDDGGQPVKLAEFLDGRTLGDLKANDPKAYEEAKAKLREGFAVDALLGNWDVIGMSYDNVLVTSTGRVLRIDNGGSLAYRAQGSLKTAEQWTRGAGADAFGMRTREINPSAYEVFVEIDDHQLKDQVRSLLANYRDRVLNEASGDPGLRQVLIDRMEAMESWTRPSKGSFPAGWKPTPASRYKRLETADERKAWLDAHYGDGKGGKWWKSLDAAEQGGVSDYSGSGYHDFNDWLRGKVKRKPRDVDRRIANLDAALAKTPTPEPIVLYRGIKDPTPVYDSLGIKSREELRLGMDITDSAFSSASPNIKKAWGSRTPLQLEIRLPKGSHGAYLGKASTVPTEEEFLLGRDHVKYRIVDIGPKWVTVEPV